MSDAIGFEAETDYCIIGAGAAGCVVADRLSESGKHRVTVIEAGPPDWHPFLHIPAGFLYAQHDPRFSWGYTIDPVPGTGERRLLAVQGRVLGGSSSINGHLFVRGQPAEYREWAQKGCRGWSYEDVLPFFKRIECFEDGATAYRGDQGPMSVIKAREVHPLSAAFVEAATSIGFPANPDFNAEEREGVGLLQTNRRGRFRAGSAQTYLRRAKRRGNLRIETNALARRVILDGKRAIGVEFSREGRKIRVLARKEVIISCGALKSPHLLQLSGIGDPDHLGSIGVPVLHALPGVGQNLRDHYSIRIVHRTRDIATLNQSTRGLKLAWHVARYLTTGNGLLANATTSAALFCRSRPELAAPDLYLAFMPGSYQSQGVLEKEDGMAIAVVRSHPDSHGTLLARSSDPDEAPAIRPNYLDSPEDQAAMVAGARIARRLYAAAPLARYSAFESRPGPEVETHDEWLDFIRRRATPGTHFVGSCRMGVDPMAVVDPELKVHGIEGLRVVDASIMPGVSSGNTNAPTVMIGEKGAHMILQAGAS